MSRFGVKQLLAYATPKLNYETTLILVGRIYNFTSIQTFGNGFIIQDAGISINSNTLVYKHPKFYVILELSPDYLIIYFEKSMKVIRKNDKHKLARYVTENWTYKMIFDCLRDVYLSLNSNIA